MVCLTFTLGVRQMNIAFTRAIRDGNPLDHQFKECNPQPHGHQRFNFDASRNHPVIILVTAVNGIEYGPTQLVVGDHYCIFQSHQVQQIIHGANTGLNHVQAQQAFTLYQHMVELD